MKTTNFLRTPWAILRNYLKALRILSAAGSSSAPGILKRYAASDGRASGSPGYETAGSVAVVPVAGILLKEVPAIYKRLEAFGIRFTEYGDITAAVKHAAADPETEKILLHVNSPGGTVAGAQEAAAAIYKARQHKKVIAYIEDLGASGGYWLASQAEEVYSNRNAGVGSIGVYTVILDSSKAAEQKGVTVHVIGSGPHKGLGTPGAPVMRKQLEPVKRYIDKLAGNMVADIARGRGKTKTDIYRASGFGALFLSGVAEARGLVDGILPSVDDALEYLDSWESPEDIVAAARKEAAEKAAARERQRQQDLRDLLFHDPDICLRAVSEGWSVEKAESFYRPIIEARIQKQKIKIRKAEERKTALEAAAEAAEKAAVRGHEGLTFYDQEW